MPLLCKLTLPEIQTSMNALLEHLTMDFLYLKATSYSTEVKLGES